MIARSSALRRGVVRARLRPVTLALAGLALTLAAGPPAHAYVRYKTATGIGFYWPQTCVPVSVYPASMMAANGNMEMTTAEIVNAAQAAASAWGASMNACTFLQINVTESTDPTPVARLDYTNNIVFRVTSWCAPSDKPGTCSYPDAALAITSVFVNKRNGQIIDGDIEVNAKNFVWTDLDQDPSGTGKQDLQNALTHEMGHLIGLDHTCFVPTVTKPGDPPSTPAIDNTGNPVPDCDDAPAVVQATTMFASAIPGDTAKRTLAPDDIEGVCDIYPVAADPMFCPAKDVAPPDAGCSLGASGGSGAGAALAALGALVIPIVAARRRRGRRT
jgi:hypothetical protein